MCWTVFWNKAVPYLQHADFTNLGVMTVRCQQGLHFSVLLLTVQVCLIPKIPGMIYQLPGLQGLIQALDSQPRAKSLWGPGEVIGLYILSPKPRVLLECGKVHIRICLLPKVIDSLALVYFIEPEIFNLKKFSTGAVT